MITEDYVSFETAKLLKEKGFDETCRAFWKVWNKHTTLCDCSPLHMFEYCHNSMLEQYNDDEELNIAAPTIQMAMKWLREKYDIHCSVGLFTDLPKTPPYWSFNILNQSTANAYYEAFDIKCETYEEACEAAIKYCLENLI